MTPASPAARRHMALVAFLQAQNCSNYVGSCRAPASTPDFLTADYYGRIARTLEDGRFDMAFFDDRLAMPDLYGHTAGRPTRAPKPLVVRRQRLPAARHAECGAPPDHRTASNPECESNPECGWKGHSVMTNKIDIDAARKLANYKGDDAVQTADYTAAFPSVKDQVSLEEWQARVDLAACYRLVDIYGMSDLTYNHITVRVPGTDTFLINLYGLLYKEVTASSLAKVDLDGNVVWKPEGTDYGVNAAGYVIHSAVHAARDDIDAVIHTHSLAGMAVASMKSGLLPSASTRCASPGIWPITTTRPSSPEAVPSRKVEGVGYTGNRSMTWL